MGRDGERNGRPPDADGDTEQRRRYGLLENYRAILNELGLLTTVSVLLFGFLLSSGGGFADTALEEWIYSLAIVLVATATLVFVLPVIYHHLQFPYKDFEKFQLRTHGWMKLGLPLLGCSLYLSLSLAIWSLFEGYALIIAALPLLATVIAFLLRRNV